MFCLGLLRQCAKIYYACKAMVHSLNPLLFHRFCCRCDLYKVPAVVMYKKSHCRHIGVVFTSIFTIQTAKSLKYSMRTKIGLVFSLSGTVNRKNLVPFDPENLRKFTPEYLVERKTPKEKIQLFPYVVAFMSLCCYYVSK